MDLGHMNFVVKWMYLFFVYFGLESIQLACQVQPKRAQVEAQYWGNPKVARLEGTSAISIIFMFCLMIVVLK